MNCMRYLKGQTWLQKFRIGCFLPNFRKFHPIPIFVITFAWEQHCAVMLLDVKVYVCLSCLPSCMLHTQCNLLSFYCRRCHVKWCPPFVVCWSQSIVCVLVTHVHLCACARVYAAQCHRCHVRRNCHVDSECNVDKAWIPLEPRSGLGMTLRCVFACVCFMFMFMQHMT